MFVARLIGRDDGTLKTSPYRHKQYSCIFQLHQETTIYTIYMLFITTYIKKKLADKWISKQTKERRGGGGGLVSE
jgi:hypothetical protein